MLLKANTSNTKLTQQLTAGCQVTVP